MKDIIIKILGKYVYGRLAYPDIANAILKKLIIELDSCEDEIADLLFDEFYAAHSTTTRIINIIKERLQLPDETNYKLPEVAPVGELLEAIKIRGSK